MSTEAKNGQGQPDPTKLQTANTPEGQFFIDDHGRTVILHGVNVIDKGYFYDPDSEEYRFIPTEEEFNETDAERLSSWGMNFVRLGVLWEGIEPERGEFDTDYLDRLEELVELFAEHGIYVLVDMHQDLYSREFGGDGAPSWAVYTDGIPFRSTSDVNWMTNYFQPAVERAFANLWENNYGLREEFTATWQQVADTVGEMPNVAGYDLFNEPVRGLYETTAGFEALHLTPFYNKLIAGIREVDDSTSVWVEPEVLFAFGKPTHLGEVSPLYDDNIGFSFHNYVNHTWINESIPGEYDIPGADTRQRSYRAVFENAERASDRLAITPVVTEFGARDVPDDVRKVVNLADEYKTGWAIWEYDILFGEDGETSPNIPVMIRPYPQAIAGIPRSFGYDEAAKRFNLVYETRETSAPTVIHVPEQEYPQGYRVHVDGGTASHRGTEYLRIINDQKASVVKVEVSPAK